MSLLATYRRLKANGVIGMNRRNADFILALNDRRHYPLVDDKLNTKRLAQEAGIAVPSLYGAIEHPHQVRLFETIVAGHEEFVVKPACGSGGEGILVVAGRTANGYRLAGGTVVTAEEMHFHLSNILAGTYSLGGQPDKALIEYRVSFHRVFERVAFQGVPDVRIIVFQGIPVMAMVRLPTRRSAGKANLHQGAVGVGIDLATGLTLDGVCRDRVVTRHPDTDVPLRGIEIPEWDRLMHHAARTYSLTHLGYQGMDMVLDADRGPLMLELNARPGLSIQIANREGLGHRLAAAAAALAATPDLLHDADRRVRFAKETFRPRPVAGGN